MRRFLILIVLLSLSCSASAVEPVWQLLQCLSDYMNAKRGYEVSFSIAAADYASEGRYCVSGDSYYIDIADAEVYCDGEVRYEVDKGRREVTIDVMDYESRNILDNPTRCFDFVEEDYTADVVECDGGVMTLKLVAKDKSVEGEIMLAVEQATGRPKRVEYILYGDRIEVEVERVEPMQGSVKRFSRSAYKDFEMIDFR